MKELVIVGAGGFGRELLQIVKDINKTEAKWKIKGFLDDNLAALDNYECDYKVIGKISDWMPSKKEVFACAIADPNVKEKIVKQLKDRGATFVSVIHPTAYIAEFTQIGEGVVMYPYAYISVNVVVGDYATLLGVGIGHDVYIGSYVTISGGCEITGGVKVEDKVFLGARVTIAQNRKIGENAYVCAGSMVLTDIKPETKVFGCPAKKIVW